MKFPLFNVLKLKYVFESIFGGTNWSSKIPYSFNICGMENFAYNSFKRLICIFLGKEPRNMSLAIWTFGLNAQLGIEDTVWKKDFFKVNNKLI